MARYHHADPTDFLARVVSLWGGGLSITTLDEARDIDRHLFDVLHTFDAVISLTGVFRQASVLRAFDRRFAEVREWTEAGGALLILDPGGTRLDGWLHRELGIRFGGLQTGEQPPLEVAEHPVFRGPFPVAECLQGERPVPGYRASVMPLEGDAIGTFPIVASTAQGPIVVAGELGRGRVLLSSLMMDWHVFAKLFVNSLAWVTRTRTVLTYGDSEALFGAQVVAPDRLFVKSESSASDAPQVQVIAETTSPVVIRWRQPDKLLIEPTDLTKSLLPIILEQINGGLWDGSPRVSLEVLRYLAMAGATDGLGGTIGLVSDSLFGASFSIARGRFVIAAALGNALPEPAWDQSKVLAAAATELDQVDQQAVVAEANAWYLAALDAGRTDFAQSIAQRALEALAAISADGLHRELTPILAMHSHSAAQVVQHATNEADDLLKEFPLPDVRALLRARPPASSILNLLDLSARFGDEQSGGLPPGFRHHLAVWAWNDVAEPAGRRALTLAHHIAFWPRHYELAAFATRAHATWRIALSPPQQEPQAAHELAILRARLDDAYRALDLPLDARHVDRPLSDLLESRPGTAFVSALRIAALPLRRVRPLLAAGTPLVAASGIGLLPLFAKDALQTIVTVQHWVRWLVFAAFVAMSLGLFAATRALHARYFLTLIVTSTAWATGVLVLAVSIFEDDLRTWRHGREIASSEGLERLGALSPSIALWGSALLLVGVVAFRRASGHRADDQ